MKALAEKGDSTLQKTMAKWGAQQAETMLAAITGIWKEFVQKEKEERALEAMNQKMKDLADKGDATLQKTMMKWGAQQAQPAGTVTARTGYPQDRKIARFFQFFAQPPSPYPSKCENSFNKFSAMY